MEEMPVDTFLEIPIADASGLDDVLGRAPGIPKLRKDLIQELGWDGKQISLGKRGTLSLNASPLLGCLTTGWRWDRGHALNLGTTYNKAGLADLVRSKNYSFCMTEVADALKQTLDRTPGPSIGRLLSRTLNDLIEKSPQLRTLAQQVTSITAQVDDSLGEMERIQGHIERLEDDDALIVLEHDQNALRLVPRSTLGALGIEEPGDLFVLHEYRWSPDAVSSFYVPAVSSESRAKRWERLEALEAKLAQREKPLQKQRPPRPGADVALTPAREADSKLKT